MALRLTPRSPGDHRFVDPDIRATRWRHRELDACFGAPEPHGFTVRSGSARLTRHCGHRIPPRERGDRVSPLCWGGTGESILLIFRFVQKIFCKSEILWCRCDPAQLTETYELCATNAAKPPSRWGGNRKHRRGECGRVSRLEAMKASWLLPGRFSQDVRPVVRRPFGSRLALRSGSTGEQTRPSRSTANP